MKTDLNDITVRVPDAFNVADQMGWPVKTPLEDSQILLTEKLLRDAFELWLTELVSEFPGVVFSQQPEYGKRMTETLLNYVERVAE